MRRLGWCVLAAVLAACGAGGPPASPGGGKAGDGAPRSTDQELARKVGELVMVGFRGARLEDSSPIVQQVRAGHVGGVVLFDVDVLSGGGRNVESPDQLRALVASLQAAAPSPLLVAIDEEGGRVSRLKEDKGFPPTAPARQLGQRNDVAATRDQARQTARTLAEAGINLNFAPVVDLDRNPASPAIGALGRSYSADPGVVTAHARAVIEEHRAAGVLTALKHFPGHGSASGDSHLGLVDVTGTWAPVELDPYRTLVREGSVDMVMTAHLVNQRLDPAWPATLSPPTIDGLLRREIGFGGPVISDDLQMGAISDEYGLDTAVRQALLAGVDVLLLANNNPRSYE
ncbi:MAG TPA: glycoside hydrolase family 3 N-terminal domain-containing protein, partial [Acidimicrobiales bacterium]|nr:glycoside hydrolase family 3 N-terminal domain-containing protein [Acidimicrobiales bacterium]